MDNKNINTKQDRSRIDIKDPAEVEYLHQKFPQLTHNEIKLSITLAGPFRKDVVVYLRKLYG